ncbi:Bug family tripartite tricarboxylate transporter substrate binding protein [Pararoseomonas indoligenes]|uniref:Tripartite tricarboxylate transporter substrate binding protein n=1 Tax=Roseomonas indoligenes TaxID=2820811 RepID=A0A940N2K9_9PROT|nr:tripartite tricarboxylate transporter substrate binding protein [Pararoseomonas indoligenes]MBP0495587.1 tripartite tricarboxylate transporter substrate binding protein [Pararoseomonas indoligenes]
MALQTMIRRRLLPALGAALLARPALAFPERTLRIISPFNPGSLSDVIARGLAQPLSGVLGQPVVVENRFGAGGGIGAAAAARAPADGHTVFLGMVDVMAVNPFTYRSLAYDPERDFAPVSFVTHVPTALIAGPSRPDIGTFADLVAAAKRAPGALSYASWGVGSTSQLSFERIARPTGASFLHVPFTGAAPAVQAVLASQVDVMVLPAGAAAAMARNGGTRVLAVASPARLPLVPEVPTLAELGLPLSLSLWQAVYVPARTPAPVIAQLNGALRQAMQAPGFVELVQTQAGRPEPGSPEELAAFERSERQAWGAVVRELDIHLE